MSGIPEIVLVDDENRVTQSLEREIRMAFGSEEFRITRFENPEEAAAYTAPPPDNLFLVISDLRMPHMSGSELLAKVRNQPLKCRRYCSPRIPILKTYKKPSPPPFKVFCSNLDEGGSRLRNFEARDIWTIRKQNNP